MSDETDLLPELVDEGLDFFNLAGDEGDKLYVRAIRQHIAAKDAEIEALRAEVEDYRTNGAAAVRFAPSSAHWSKELRRLFGDDARTGIEVLENRHRQELARAERLAEALRLIAAPKRPDGTWNRDREACRQIAAEAIAAAQENDDA